MATKKNENAFDSKRFLGTKDDTNKGKVNKEGRQALSRLQVQTKTTKKKK